MSLLSCGSNAHGQLASGSLEDSNRFQRCSFFGHPSGILPPNTNRVLDIACGANHTLILLEVIDEATGLAIQLWGCGDGRAGQLGPSYMSDVQRNGGLSSVFHQLEIPLGGDPSRRYIYKHVAAAWETTYITFSSPGHSDILISMGADDFGDLGIGGLKRRGKGPNAASIFHNVSFDHLHIHGKSLKDASLTIESLCSGQHHAVVHLRAAWADSSVTTFLAGWGSSRHGQLGQIINSDGRPALFAPTPRILFLSQADDAVVSSALGSQHSAFLLASGRVLGWGSDKKGQIGQISELADVRIVGCTWNGTYAVVSGFYPVELPFAPPTRAVKGIACGTEHVLVSLQSGAEMGVWGWGWNEHGNLGLGTTADVGRPAKIWPHAVSSYTGRVAGIWAGSGTSWIYSTE
ncbi:regulator of chromosome condensation 1/beta-lactamase-inhibitor protein II [Infundibulicybe gibba]|nr:regulator of chromosome condensation 1/beta-lactamase-inhibitor protein II [Infundibulicybe gibba]